MAGYIVYNGFWNAVPPEPAQRMLAAASRRGVTLTALPNTALTMSVAPPRVTRPDGTSFSSDDYVLFWDKDTRLATLLESVGVRVYNSARAIMVCDDKSETHRLLAEQGIAQPSTLLAPMTYTEVTAPIDAFLASAAKILGFPMIVKECYGSFGDQVSLVHTVEELRGLAMRMESRPFILQQFIREAAGEDFRLYVVGDRVVAAMCRRSHGDFRANLRQGGTAEPYTPTEEETALALRCCRILGLSFGGVDLLHTADGTVLVCEVNSNAHLAGITACTNVDVADAILTWVWQQEEQRKER